jgi:tripartite-type tricarboxylate transporter receptor subunit TctC
MDLAAMRARLAASGVPLNEGRWRRFMRLVTFALAATLAAATAHAETYPEKPIHIVALFSPGSAADVTARAIAQTRCPRSSDGRVTTLAVGSAKRSTVLPDLPTTEEAGYPDTAYRFWVGMLTPSGAPPAVIERLNTEVRQALATPEIKQRLAALGADAAPMTPAEFDRLIARELVENAALAREAGINPQ